MAHPEAAYGIIAERLGALPGVTETKMFRTVVFLLDENMIAGAMKGAALARVGKANEAAALALPGVEAATPSGRRMAGFVRLAEAELIEAPETLERLTDMALSFVASLPAKPRNPKGASYCGSLNQTLGLGFRGSPLADSTWKTKEVFHGCGASASFGLFWRRSASVGAQER